MTYKVLKSLVYGGIAYDEGQEVDIIEKSVAENCLYQCMAQCGLFCDFCNLCLFFLWIL